MKSYWTYATAVLLLFSVCLTACKSVADQLPSPPVSVEQLNIPEDYDYRGMSWLPNGQLVFWTQQEYRPTIWYLVQGEDQWHELSLAEDPSCDNPFFYGFRLLPDGRIGIIKVCDSVHKDDHTFLIAYNFKTGKQAQVVASPLKDLSGQFTWNPQMTLGIQEKGTGLNDTFYWITPDGIAPMNITIRQGRRSFSLIENYQEIKANIDAGIVWSPAWSPDGRLIAFFANLDAIGVMGLDRLGGRWNLFLMDPEELKPYSVLEIYEPTVLYWSPDSRWLAFRAQAGSQHTDGIWLYSQASGKLYLVAQGSFANLDWSPDGLKIAAIHCPDISCKDQTQLSIYDVSRIVNKSGQ